MKTTKLKNGLNFESGSERNGFTDKPDFFAMITTDKGIIVAGFSGCKSPLAAARKTAISYRSKVNA